MKKTSIQALFVFVAFFPRALVSQNAASLSLEPISRVPAPDKTSENNDSTQKLSEVNTANTPTTGGIRWMEPSTELEDNVLKKEIFTPPSFHAFCNTSTRKITASDYCLFLNMEGSRDPLHLYNEKMATDPAAASIIRQGTSGSYTYSLISGHENYSIFYVSELAKIYFGNWLEKRNLIEKKTAISIADTDTFSNPGDHFVNAITLKKTDTNYFNNKEKELFQDEVSLSLTSNKSSFLVTYSNPALMMIGPEDSISFFSEGELLSDFLLVMFGITTHSIPREEVAFAGEETKALSPIAPPSTPPEGTMHPFEQPSEIKFRLALRHTIDNVPKNQSSDHKAEEKDQAFLETYDSLGELWRSYAKKKLGDSATEEEITELKMYDQQALQLASEEKKDYDKWIRNAARWKSIATMDKHLKKATEYAQRDDKLALSENEKNEAYNEETSWLALVDKDFSEALKAITQKESLELTPSQAKANEANFKKLSKAAQVAYLETIASHHSLQTINELLKKSLEESDRAVLKYLHPHATGSCFAPPSLYEERDSVAWRNQAVTDCLTMAQPKKTDDEYSALFSLMREELLEDPLQEEAAAKIAETVSLAKASYQQQVIQEALLMVRERDPNALTEWEKRSTLAYQARQTAEKLFDTARSKSMEALQKLATHVTEKALQEMQKAGDALTDNIKEQTIERTKQKIETLSRIQGAGIGAVIGSSLGIVGGPFAAISIPVGGAIGSCLGAISPGAARLAEQWLEKRAEQIKETIGTSIDKAKKYMNREAEKKVFENSLEWSTFFAKADQYAYEIAKIEHQRLTTIEEAYLRAKQRYFKTTISKIGDAAIKHREGYPDDWNRLPAYCRAAYQKASPPSPESSISQKLFPSSPEKSETSILWREGSEREDIIKNLIAEANTAINKPKGFSSHRIKKDEAQRNEILETLLWLTTEDERGNLINEALQEMLTQTQADFFTALDKEWSAFEKTSYRQEEEQASSQISANSSPVMSALTSLFSLKKPSSFAETNSEKTKLEQGENEKTANYIEAIEKTLERIRSKYPQLKPIQPNISLPTLNKAEKAAQKKATTLSQTTETKANKLRSDFILAQKRVERLRKREYAISEATIKIWRDSIATVESSESLPAPYTPENSKRTTPLSHTSSSGKISSSEGIEDHFIPNFDEKIYQEGIFNSELFEEEVSLSLNEYLSDFIKKNNIRNPLAIQELKTKLDEAEIWQRLSFEEKKAQLEQIISEQIRNQTSFIDKANNSDADEFAGQLVHFITRDAENLIAAAFGYKALALKIFEEKRAIPAGKKASEVQAIYQQAEKDKNRKISEKYKKEVSVTKIIAEATQQAKANAWHEFQARAIPPAPPLPNEEDSPTNKAPSPVSELHRELVSPVKKYLSSNSLKDFETLSPSPPPSLQRSQSASLDDLLSVAETLSANMMNADHQIPPQEICNQIAHLDKKIQELEKELSPVLDQDRNEEVIQKKGELLWFRAEQASLRAQQEKNQLSEIEAKEAWEKALLEKERIANSGDSSLLLRFQIAWAQAEISDWDAQSEGTKDYLEFKAKTTYLPLPSQNQAPTSIEKAAKAATKWGDYIQLYEENCHLLPHAEKTDTESRIAKAAWESRIAKAKYWKAVFDVWPTWLAAEQATRAAIILTKEARDPELDPRSSAFEDHWRKAINATDRAQKSWCALTDSYQLHKKELSKSKKEKWSKDQYLSKYIADHYAFLRFWLQAEQKNRLAEITKNEANEASPEAPAFEDLYQIAIDRAVISKDKWEEAIKNHPLNNKSLPLDEKDLSSEEKLEAAKHWKNYYLFDINHLKGEKKKKQAHLLLGKTLLLQPDVSDFLEEWENDFEEQWQKTLSLFQESHDEFIEAQKICDDAISQAPPKDQIGFWQQQSSLVKEEIANSALVKIWAEANKTTTLAKFIEKQNTPLEIPQAIKEAEEKWLTFIKKYDELKQNNLLGDKEEKWDKEFYLAKYRYYDLSHRSEWLEAEDQMAKLKQKIKRTLASDEEDPDFQRLKSETLKKINQSKILWENIISLYQGDKKNLHESVHPSWDELINKANYNYFFCATRESILHAKIASKTASVASLRAKGLSVEDESFQKKWISAIDTFYKARSAWQIAIEEYSKLRDTILGNHLSQWDKLSYKAKEFYQKTDDSVSTLIDQTRGTSDDATAAFYQIDRNLGENIDIEETYTEALEKAKKAERAWGELVQIAEQLGESIPPEEKEKWKQHLQTAAYEQAFYARQTHWIEAEKIAYTGAEASRERALITYPPNLEELDSAHNDAIKAEEALQELLDFYETTPMPSNGEQTEDTGDLISAEASLAIEEANRIVITSYQNALTSPLNDSSLLDNNWNRAISAASKAKEALEASIEKSPDERNIIKAHYWSAFYSAWPFWCNAIRSSQIARAATNQASLLSEENIGIDTLSEDQLLSIIEKRSTAEEAWKKAYTVYNNQRASDLLPQTKLETWDRYLSTISHQKTYWNNKKEDATQLYLNKLWSKATHAEENVRQLLSQTGFLNSQNSFAHLSSELLEKITLAENSFSHFLERYDSLPPLSETSKEFWQEKIATANNSKTYWQNQHAIFEKRKLDAKRSWSLLQRWKN